LVLCGGVAPPPTGGFCFFSFQLGGKDAPPADRALHGDRRLLVAGLEAVLSVRVLHQVLT